RQHGLAAAAARRERAGDAARGVRRTGSGRPVPRRGAAGRLVGADLLAERLLLRPTPSCVAGGRASGVPASAGMIGAMERGGLWRQRPFMLFWTGQTVSV